MDLTTVSDRLHAASYSDPILFCKDVRLIFNNSKSYNINKKSRVSYRWISRHVQVAALLRWVLSYEAIQDACMFASVRDVRICRFSRWRYDCQQCLKIIWRSSSMISKVQKNTKEQEDILRNTSKLIFVFINFDIGAWLSMQTIRSPNNITSPKIVSGNMLQFLKLKINFFITDGPTCSIKFINLYSIWTIPCWISTTTYHYPSHWKCWHYSESYMVGHGYGPR